jgi:murein peptide amidase A
MSAADTRSPARLGKNKKNYAGETIAMRQVIPDVVASARVNGWSVEWLKIHPDHELPVFSRVSDLEKSRIYISSGVHGDEPAGPLAIQKLIDEDQWPSTASLWVVPCLNIRGFELNQRENPDGIDLNRDYRHLQTAEVRAHIGWLEKQPPFALCLCLHEDWEAGGFYLYEQNPEHRFSLAEAMTRRVSEVCPVDPSPIIENRPATNGIIRPDLDINKRPQWPEAFYLLMRKTRQTYTLEAPSDFALPVRVGALVAAVHAAVDTFAARF